LKNNSGIVGIEKGTINMITKQDILKEIKKYNEKSHNDKQPSWLEAYQMKKELLEELNNK